MTEKVAMGMCMLICAGVSFLCSGMEAGVFSLNRFRIRSLAASGNKSAQLLQQYLEAPERFLISGLVANSVASFVGLGLAFLMLAEYFQNFPELHVVVYGGVVFLFYTFVDLLPKIIYRANPERLCFASVKVYGMLEALFKPLVSIVELATGIISRALGAQPRRAFLGRDEFRLIMEESISGMPSDEQAMVRRVLDLQVMRVKHLAKPLSEVVSVDSATPIRDVLTVAQTFGLSRLPVWGVENGRKAIIGMVEIDSIIFSNSDLTRVTAGQCVQPIMSLDEDLPAEVALTRMRRAGQRLAVVTRQTGGPIGIVTLTDILETVFGSVQFG